MATTELDVLERIDQKLGALLSLALLSHLPESAPARKRSMDKTLRDAGMDVAEIAALLGKSKQAVYLALDASKKKKPVKKPKPGSAT